MPDDDVSGESGIYILKKKGPGLQLWHSGNIFMNVYNNAHLLLCV